MSTEAERIFARQKAVAVATYWLLRPFHAFRKRPISWVVGAHETALMVSHIAATIPGSHSLVRHEHPFYSVRYDTVIEKSDRLAKYRRLYGGAIALGVLANRAQGFLYVGQAGILFSEIDRRNFEFRFLKKHGLGLVCYFTGNDIRSPALMHELERTTGRRNLATHMDELNPVFATAEYEQAKREIARVADSYADLIFNARLDQLSHLTSPTEPFMYFFPDERFSLNERKFDDVERFIVVHAPSKPLLKGTAHVRDAVDRLRAEGYDFDYRELIDVSNDEVIETLGQAHIVLNQFYAFIPGVFGIEAMASCCAMLASADANIETDLGPDANEAWVVTAPEEIYTNLKHLLDNPSSVKEQALRGFEWAKRNASASADGERMRALLAGIPTPTGR